jgi:hypothetical protein
VVAQQSAPATKLAPPAQNPSKAPTPSPVTPKAQPARPATPPAAAPTTPTGTIVITGLAAGAKVRLDGQERANRWLVVPAGSHVLSLVIGGVVKRTDSIRVPAGGKVTWSPVVTAPTPKSVATTPPPPPPPAPKASTKVTGPTCRTMMEAERWEDAAMLCAKEADAGRSSAQRDLGELYERGRGVARSDADAAKWYTRAADGGDRDAMFRIAVAYERGHGVKKDGPTALVWYTRAANAGSADAQFTVGQAHEKGKFGAPKDKATALDWYRKAAAQGHKDAVEKVKDLSK